MKRILVLFLMLILALNVTLLAAKQPADSLYLKLYKKAVGNLNNLPVYAKAEYTGLLRKHPDRVMAFLLAYEENGRLVQANPQWMENHWQSVTDLMQERNIKQPDEFFLSYVAKCTVSDEPISDYRKQFEANEFTDLKYANLDLKALRQTTSDPAELYRIAMLKTTETLRYIPTSGRDQSPMDVAARSLYGRCEEWQILFIAICRTLGLPARPASTPWWAHQDDNHAWAEIFIDGKWVYDGGYWPEQNWFTGLTDKMVLIVADGTLPAKDDEVLSQDASGAVVNSTIHYAKENARKVKVIVVDKAGKPVAKCPLAINVYNTYSLRPQAFTYTDKLGTKTITVGQGAFFLMAIQDSLTAMQYIPSGGDKEQTYTLTLNRADLSAESVNMEYPSKRVTFREDPQSWKDASKQANDVWQKKVDDLLLITRPAFFERAGKMDKLQILDFADSLRGNGNNYYLSQLAGIKTLRLKYPHLVDISDSLYFKVLKRSRFNFHFWLDFDKNRVYDQVKTKELKQYLANNNNQFPPLESLNPDWLQVLLENDEKDLWQSTNGQFFDRMYHWFQDIYPRTSYLPRQELLNLLDPTVFYENLPWQSHYQWAANAAEGMYPSRMILTKPLKPSPRQVYKLFKKQHQIKPEKALSGLLPLDIALTQKNLTGYNYKILACYYMRANQIPANYTRIPSVIAVYTDSTWKYFDISKGDYYQMEKAAKRNTPDQMSTTRKVTLTCVDEWKQPVPLKPEQIQICFLKDGQFFPTNEQPDYKGNGSFEAEVPVQGRLYAQIGYRNSDSLTVYFLRPLSVDGKPVETLNLECRNFQRKWLDTEDFLAPVTAELDKQGYSFAILGNYTLENTLRMATKFQTAGKKFTVIGYQEGKPGGFEYAVWPVYQDLVTRIPSLQSRTITLIRNEQSGSWQMYEGLWDTLP